MSDCFPLLSVFCSYKHFRLGNEMEGLEHAHTCIDNIVASV